MSSNSFLLTERHGPEDAMPWLVLHDRWGMIEDAVALGTVLGPAALTIGVRAPRVQNQGGTGQTKGYFWTVGPVDAPELSTLGDALYELEVLLNETLERYQKSQIGVLGKGQGGVVALLLASIFPDRIKRVIAIDAALPRNMAVMPIEPSLGGVEVVLVGSQTQAESEALTALGGIVSRASEADIPALAG